MGNGIAHVFAMKGFAVYLTEMNEEFFNKAIKTITLNLDRQVKKQVITENDKNETLTRITKVIGIENIPSDTNLIIEAIYENKEAKLNIFKQLEKQINPDCIFASNTSSISITELSAICRADKFIGMHFMNPVPLMKLVEVISGMATSQETTERIVTLAQSLGKEVSKSLDYPGFVVNRILMPMINEAFNVLMENIATAEDIDKGMKLGTNQPMGPLTLADFIGLDTCFAIMRVLYDGTFDPRYRPSPLLAKYVEAGYLGRKSGRGVYNYNAI